jgi:hypothetical protein
METLIKHCNLSGNLGSYHIACRKGDVKQCYTAMYNATMQF